MAKRDPAFDDLGLTDDFFMDLDEEESDLDGIDVDSEEIDSKKARTPIQKLRVVTKDLSKVGRSAVGGAGVAIAAKVNQAFPDAGSLASEAIQVASDVKRLKDDVMKDVRPVLNQSKIVGRQLLKFAEDVIPTKIYDKLVNDVLKPQEDQREEKLDKAEARANAMQAEMAAIFKAQVTERNIERKRLAVERIVDQQMTQSRHVELAGMTSDIRNQAMFHTAFMKSTMTAYMKKSLELKYKHLFIAEDTLETIRVATQMQEERLDAIRHNTSLPDSQKIYLKEVMAKNMNEGIANYFSQGTRGIAKKLFGDVIEKVKENTIKPMIESLGSINDMGQSFVDMLQMEEDMNGKQSAKGTILGMAGGAMGGFIGNKVFKKIFEKLPPDVAKTVQSMGKYGSRYIPLLMREVAEGRVEGKYLDKLKPILDAAGIDWEGRTDKVTNKTGDDPLGDGRITNRFTTTVEEIIPGYLAKQTNYLAALVQKAGFDPDRMTDRELTWDFKKGTWTTYGQQKEMLTNMLKRDRKSSAANMMGNLRVLQDAAKSSDKKSGGHAAFQLKNVEKDAAVFLQNLANERRIYGKKVIDTDMLRKAANGDFSDEYNQVAFRGIYKEVSVPDGFGGTTTQACPEAVGLAQVLLSIFVEKDGKTDYTPAIEAATAQVIKSMKFDDSDKLIDTITNYGGLRAAMDAGLIEVDERGEHKVKDTTRKTQHLDITREEMEKAGASGEYDSFGEAIREKTTTEASVDLLKDMGSAALRKTKSGIATGTRAVASYVGMEEQYDQMLQKINGSFYQMGEFYRNKKNQLGELVKKGGGAVFNKAYNWLINHKNPNYNIFAVVAMEESEPHWFKSDMTADEVAHAVGTNKAFYKALYDICHPEKNAGLWLVREILPPALRKLGEMEEKELKELLAKAPDTGAALAAAITEFIDAENEERVKAGLGAWSEQEIKLRRREIEMHLRRVNGDLLDKKKLKKMTAVEREQYLKEVAKFEKQTKMTKDDVENVQHIKKMAQRNLREQVGTSHSKLAPLPEKLQKKYEKTRIENGRNAAGEEVGKEAARKERNAMRRAAKKKEYEESILGQMDLAEKRDQKARDLAAKEAEVQKAALDAYMDEFKKNFLDSLRKQIKTKSGDPAAKARLKFFTEQTRVEDGKTIVGRKFDDKRKAAQETELKRQVLAEQEAIRNNMSDTLWLRMLEDMHGGQILLSPDGKVLYDRKGKNKKPIIFAPLGARSRRAPKDEEEVTQFAEGGLVDEPTLIHGGRALVGEHGPEIVVPLNGNQKSLEAYLQAKEYFEGQDGPGVALGKIRAYAEGGPVKNDLRGTFMNTGEVMEPRHPIRWAKGKYDSAKESVMRKYHSAVATYNKAKQAIVSGKNWTVDKYRKAVAAYQAAKRGVIAAKNAVVRAFGVAKQIGSDLWSGAKAVGRGAKRTWGIMKDIGSGLWDGAKAVGKGAAWLGRGSWNVFKKLAMFDLWAAKQGWKGAKAVGRGVKGIYDWVRYGNHKPQAYAEGGLVDPDNLTINTDAFAIDPHMFDGLGDDIPAGPSIFERMKNFGSEKFQQAKNFLPGFKDKLVDKAKSAIGGPERLMAMQAASLRMLQRIYTHMGGTEDTSDVDKILTSSSVVEVAREAGVTVPDTIVKSQGLLSKAWDKITGFGRGIKNRLISPTIDNVTVAAKDTLRNRICDVYRKPMGDQKLTKSLRLLTITQLQKGVYFDKEKKERVNSVTDINRPVYGPRGGCLINDMDLEAGLVDEDGVPIRPPLAAATRGVKKLSFGIMGKIKDKAIEKQDFLKELAASPIAFLKSMFRPFQDVYLKDHVQDGPLVTQKALEAGLVVFDDGKPVKSVYKINRPVVYTDDKANGKRRKQVAILMEHIEAGLVDIDNKPFAKIGTGMGSSIGGAVRGAIGLGMRFGGLAGAMVTGAAAFAWAGIKKIALKTTDEYIKDDPYQDVYVKDEVQPGHPKLYWRQIKKGAYIFEDGSVVQSVFDIDKPVLYAKSRKTALSDEDLEKGIVDVDNKPFTKKVNKAISLVKGTIKGAWDLGKRVLGGIKNFALGAWNRAKKIGGRIAQFLGIKKGAGEEVFGGLHSVFGDLFKTSTIQRKDLEEVVGDRLQKIYDLLATQYGGKKPMAGDKDGDGDRDNSYEDQMQRRKDKQKGKAAPFGNLDDFMAKMMAANAMKKDEGGGFFSGLWDGAKNLAGGAAGLLGLKSLWSKIRGKKGAEAASKTAAKAGGKGFAKKLAKAAVKNPKLAVLAGLLGLGSISGSDEEPSEQVTAKEDAREKVNDSALNVGIDAAMLGGEAAAKTAAGTAAKEAAKAGVGRAMAKFGVKAGTKMAVSAGANVVPVAGQVASALIAASTVYDVGVLAKDLIKYGMTSDEEFQLIDIKMKMYGIADQEILEEIEELAFDLYEENEGVLPDTLPEGIFRKWIRSTDLKDMWTECERANARFAGKMPVDENGKPDLLKDKKTLKKYFDTWYTFRFKPICQAFFQTVQSQIGRFKSKDPEDYIKMDPTDFDDMDKDWQADYVANFEKDTKKFVSSRKDLNDLVPTGDGFKAYMKKYGEVKDQGKDDKKDKDSKASEMPKPNGPSESVKKQVEENKAAGKDAIEQAKAQVTQQIIDSKALARSNQDFQKQLNKADEMQAAQAQGKIYTDTTLGGGAKVQNSATFDEGTGGGSALDKGQQSLQAGAGSPTGGSGGSAGDTTPGNPQTAAPLGTQSHSQELVELKDVTGNQAYALSGSKYRWQRNKNPGNVKGTATQGAQYQGRDDKGHMKFATYSDGIIFWRDYMVRKYFSQGLNTLRKILPIYAPESDGNNHAEYFRVMKSVSGLGPDDPIDINSGDNFAKLARGMFVMEAGHRFSIEEINGIWNAAKNGGTGTGSNASAGGTGGSAVATSTSAGGSSGGGASAAGGGGASAGGSASTGGAGASEAAGGAQVAAPKSATEAIQKLQSLGVQAFNTTGGGGYNGVAKVNPDLLIRFAAAVEEFQGKYGKDISITSAWRSSADQASLQGTPGAGKVGKSPHQRGEALDIGDAQGTGVKDHGYGTGTVADKFEPIAKKYGLWRPYNPMEPGSYPLKHEEQHFQVKKGAPPLQTPEAAGVGENENKSGGQNDGTTPPPTPQETQAAATGTNADTGAPVGSEKTAQAAASKAAAGDTAGAAATAREAKKAAEDKKIAENTGSSSGGGTTLTMDEWIAQGGSADDYPGKKSGSSDTAAKKEEFQKSGGSSRAEEGTGSLDDAIKAAQASGGKIPTPSNDAAQSAFNKYAAKASGDGSSNDAAKAAFDKYSPAAAAAAQAASTATPSTGGNSGGSGAGSSTGGVSVQTNTPSQTGSVGEAASGDAQLAELKIISQILSDFRTDMNNNFKVLTPKSADGSTGPSVTNPATPSSPDTVAKAIFDKLLTMVNGVAPNQGTPNAQASAPAGGSGSASRQQTAPIDNKKRSPTIT